MTAKADEDLFRFDFEQLDLPASVSQRNGIPALRSVHAWDDPFLTGLGEERQANRLEVRIAMIGSARLFHGLSPVCELIVLNRRSWREVLNAVRPAMLIMDGFTRSFGDEWQIEQIHGDETLTQIIEAFQAAGIPTVFWNTLDIQYADHLAGFAARFDERFFSDARQSAAAAGELLPPACSPTVHTPLASHADAASVAPVVLFDGWVDYLRNKSELSILEHLMEYGLTVVESRYRLFRNQIESSGALGPSILGCVTAPSLWTLYRQCQAAIFSKHTISTPHAQHWAMVEAAACGAAIVYHGKPEAGGLPNEFFEAHGGDRQALGAIHELLASPVRALVASQQNWRYTIEGHTYAHRLQLISDRLGLGLRWLDQPKVTVLTATFRLKFIPKILEQFDSQTYSNKELSLVVNSSSISREEVVEMIGARDDVRAIVVPAERVEAGSLNHGIRMATGDYIVKMDDDDIYGPHYVADMMLHARAHDLDLFGKANRFFYFAELDKTFERRNKRSLVRVDLKDLLTAHIGGATLSGKTTFFRANPYPEGNFSATDTHYYSNLAGQIEGRFALLDDTGFIYYRRVAAEHSWQIDNEKLLANMEFVADGIAQKVMQ